MRIVILRIPMEQRNRVSIDQIIPLLSVVLGTVLIGDARSMNTIYPFLRINHRLFLPPR